METKRQKSTMSVPEMGRLLGLKKVESYWLVHKGYFETIQVEGKMRVVRESFERWYAGQVKYRKVTGEEPGIKLKQESLSVREIAEILDISESSTYDLVDREQLPTVLVDCWKRVPKEAFEKWYAGQSRYRTAEDREKDATLEENSLTMPDMARLLDVPRKNVYEILRSDRGKQILQVITVGGKKRILKRSFDIWYAGQTEYLKPEDREKHPGPNTGLHYADCLVGKKQLQNKPPQEKTSSNPDYLTMDEAAHMIGGDRMKLRRWIRKQRFPVIRYSNSLIRIPRKEFEDYIAAAPETEV